MVRSQLPLPITADDTESARTHLNSPYDHRSRTNAKTHLTIAAKQVGAACRIANCCFSIGISMKNMLRGSTCRPSHAHRSWTNPKTHLSHRPQAGRHRVGGVVPCCFRGVSVDHRIRPYHSMGGGRRVALCPDRLFTRLLPEPCTLR